MDKTKQDNADCIGKVAGRPKAADVEARTQELLRTAGELFLKNGYTKTSLEAIAKAAHVAVRTIYVKFGGKTGLLHAVMAAKRDRFFKGQALETDTRPFREIVRDFAIQFHEMINSPEAVELQRIILAEAPTNPELAEAYWNGGPRMTREMLGRFFARPDIRAQLQPDVPLDLLPGFLLTCVMGDFTTCFVFARVRGSVEKDRADMERRLDLFFHSVLPHPVA
jgi:TetR/AcrR family transcriptional repressor of mexJK operon